VVFNAITRQEISRAFDEPQSIDLDRVNAQQARRILDRIVGYLGSPFLWKKVARGLSAGRVQSVAVRLVVEREREIMAFTPDEFWKIAGYFTTERSYAHFGRCSSHGNWPNNDTNSHLDHILIDFSAGVFPLLPEICRNLRRRFRDRQYRTTVAHGGLMSTLAMPSSSEITDRPHSRVPGRSTGSGVRVPLEDRSRS